MQPIGNISNLLTLITAAMNITYAGAKRWFIFEPHKQGLTLVPWTKCFDFKLNTTALKIIRRFGKVESR